MEMEAFSETTLIAITIALVFLYQLVSLLKLSNNVKIPPGPAPLPIIGSLHKLGNLPHKSLANLAKKHGPIMSLKLGSTTTIVVSSPATAKEVLQKQDLTFSTRSVPDALYTDHHSKYSVVWLPVSTRWRSLRRILNTHMFSVNRLDATKHLRARKVNELVKYCCKHGESGDPVDIGQVAFSTTLNVLSNMMLSTDLTDILHDSGTEFKELVRNIMVASGKANLVDFYPCLKRFDPQGRRRQMGAYLRKLHQIFDELIHRRLESRKLKKNDAKCDADLLDVCLNIARENPDEIDHVHMERMFFELTQHQPH
jgi:geraniol 8-hydroxylase